MFRNLQNPPPHDLLPCKISWCACSSIHGCTIGGCRIRYNGPITIEYLNRIAFTDIEDVQPESGSTVLHLREDIVGVSGSTGGTTSLSLSLSQKDGSTVLQEVQYYRRS